MKHSNENKKLPHDLSRREEFHPGDSLLAREIESRLNRALENVRKIRATSEPKNRFRSRLRKKIRSRSGLKNNLDLDLDLDLELKLH